MFLEKIKINVQKLKPCEIPLVLISCGSFSPITFSHLRMIEMAKDYFNQSNGNLRVVGGILSPVSDAYEKPSLINFEHRLEMCRLASENNPLVSVDTWEASQPTWTPTLDVLTHFDRELRLDPSCSRVKIMLLAGSDLVEGFKDKTLWSPDSIRDILDYGLVVIERPGLDDAMNTNIESEFQYVDTEIVDIHNHANIHRISQPVPCAISSSKLRNMIKNNMSIKYLTSDKVIEYINENNLYK